MRKTPFSARSFLLDPGHYLHAAAIWILHALEVAAIAGGSLALLYLLFRLAPLVGRRRLARAGTRFEVSLPEEPDRQALVNLFRSLAHLLRPRLLRPAPWIGFAFTAYGAELTVDLFCSGRVPAEDVREALEHALNGASVERVAEVPLIPIGTFSATCSLVASDSPALPLEADHESDPSRMVLSALKGRSADEGAVLQLLLRPAPSSVRRRALTRARKLRRGGSRSLWPAPLRFGAEVAGEFVDASYRSVVARPRRDPQRHRFRLIHSRSSGRSCSRQRRRSRFWSAHFAS